MAYSDYGAYIWKNDKNITENCADSTYYFINGKFQKNNDEIKLDDENIISASGHAVLCFESFCIEFFKVYNPVIVFSNGEKIKTDCLNFKNYENKKIKLKISGYYLDDLELINMFQVSYQGNNYCVVCGSQVGNGLDNNYTSKYIIKNLYYDKERGYYFINTKYDVEISSVLNKLIRLDDIKFEKYLMKTYALKPMIKDLFKLDFEGVLFHLEEYLEHKEKIKWLK